MFAVRFVDESKADSILEGLVLELKSALEKLEVTNSKGELHDQDKLRSLRVRHNHLR
jgi:hypothetical protein